MLAFVYKFSQSLKEEAQRKILKAGDPVQEGWKGRLVPKRNFEAESRGERSHLGCNTYNIHDGQDVLFDVSPAMIAHHHLVSHHQGLNVTLCAD